MIGAPDGVGFGAKVERIFKNVKAAMAPASEDYPYQRFEDRLKPAGEKDETATAVFQQYELPGQEQRHLVDDTEYVRRVDNGDLTGLIGVVQQERELLKTLYTTKYGVRNPEPDANVQVIFGDSRFPERCYRHTLLNTVLKPSGEVDLVLQPNSVSVETGGVHRVMYKKDDARDIEVTPVPGTENRNGKESVQVYHQRLPEDKSVYSGHVIVPWGRESGSLWVVSKDAAKLAGK
jgi:hypothetical protein